MRARPGIMLVLTVLLAVCTGACARNFNITYLEVPGLVPPGNGEVMIECGYDGNFTLLSWFKGANEFFRYRPGAAPSTRSFPILGVGTVEMVTCGPTVCQLKLGALTEEATGLYRCDIERDVPPYKFATRVAHMEVLGHAYEHRKPLLEGLAEEYKEGDLIQAYCRGGPDSELRWYINGAEVEEMRGSTNLKKKSSRYIFMGVPPKVTVQCAEFRYGKIYGSREQKARWNEIAQIVQKEKPAVMKNGSFNVITGSLSLLSIIIFIFVL